MLSNDVPDPTPKLAKDVLDLLAREPRRTATLVLVLSTRSQLNTREDVQAALDYLKRRGAIYSEDEGNTSAWRLAHSTGRMSPVGGVALMPPRHTSATRRTVIALCIQHPEAENKKLAALADVSDSMVGDYRLKLRATFGSDIFTDEYQPEAARERTAGHHPACIASDTGDATDCTCGGAPATRVLVQDTTSGDQRDHVIVAAQPRGLDALWGPAPVEEEALTPADRAPKKDKVTAKAGEPLGAAVQRALADHHKLLVATEPPRERAVSLAVPPLSVGDEVELVIDDMGREGNTNAIAHFNRFVVMVPEGKLGDKVFARVILVRDTWAKAIILKRL